MILFNCIPNYISSSFYCYLCWNIGRHIHFIEQVPEFGLSIEVPESDPIIPYIMLLTCSMIFCRANRTADRYLKLLWKVIANVSGQLIKNYKPIVQFSKRTENRQKHTIVDTLTVPTSHSVGTYLEPWVIFYNLRTNFSSKLMGWKLCPFTSR